MYRIEINHYHKKFDEIYNNRKVLKPLSIRKYKRYEISEFLIIKGSLKYIKFFVEHYNISEPIFQIINKNYFKQVIL